MKKYLLSLLALTLASGVSAKVKPGSLLSDNMVLQQNADAKLYGSATPESTVSITTSWGATARTQAGKDGKWSTTVATPAASFEPRSITISDGEPLTLNNILIGEVWLASGQSNMQMPLKGFDGCCVLGGYDEIAASRRQAGRIRFYTVPLTQSYEPVDTVASQWVVPSPETAPEFSAVAWHYAKRLSDVLDVPVGVVSAAFGGARVESWMPREILETYPDVSLKKDDIEAMTHYWRPMLMYNAMFSPIKDYTYKGMIWYQGCSNVRTYDTYADRLATMVKHWRSEIGQGDIPFYAVEIAPYDYDDPAETSRSPLLREAQWKALSMIPNSGMISINDLVEPFERKNIHPGNKTAVGNRLGNLALNRTYGKKQFPADHPRYKSHRFKDGAAWVAIESPCAGICRNYDIRGFEVAGADKVFHPADKVWLHWQTNEMVVSSEAVPEPVAVRYAWGDFKPGTLHAADYLPLLPFRSDNWEPENNGPKGY